ncbi:hypothetical protein STASHLEY_00960 [Brevundimonas phage vB_BpoS-StAshley]|nr:hypothetical protein STASHLEY_00960 [Brevundimonas phage vB_BpoS-StAshley]
MTKKLGLLLCLGLVACDTRPKTATWQEVCIRSEPVLIGYYPMQVGQVMIMQPMWGSECVEAVQQCRPGKDGTTICKGPQP